MFCSQCGAVVQDSASFCSQCGASVSSALSINAQSHVSKSTIWNPNATANWSLLFSPALGAYLQMLNWRVLGKPEEEASSRNWFYISLGMLALYVFAGVFEVFVSGSKAVIGAMRLFGLAFLLAWYFSSGRKQSQYVKEKYGSSYPRKPWGKTLLIAVGFAIAYFVVAAIAGVIAGVVHAVISR
jgi:hypothetical protein